MKNAFIYICLAVFLANVCQAKTTLKVMQFNIWQEGTVVPGGFDAIVDEIATRKPDLVTFSEVRNYNNIDFMKRLTNALDMRGLTYYAEPSVSTGIVSRYPILKQEVVYPLKDDRGSVIKAIVDVKGKKVAVYSAHLDWLDCACYIPRGYDGSTWKKLPTPIVDPEAILKSSNASFRDDEIRALLADAKEETAKGTLVFIGGDFNEPSHLDWQTDTKDIRDHQGAVVNWECSIILSDAGFKDAYREIYPNPVTHPGFTFPANNPLVDLSKLTWAPEADERDRIDFIYYYPATNVSLKKISIVGPAGSIFHGKRTFRDADSKDKFLLPIKVWPTDHKAILATFVLE